VSFFEELTREPWRFDLFAVLRRLERENAAKPKIGDAATLEDEFVEITQNPYLEFPASTLEGASREGNGRVRLIARFLGMFGPQGALPLTTTAETYTWLLERDDAFVRFVDIVQRRFLELFYRAWADARPIAQHDRPASDRFLAYIGSTIGVGTPSFKDADSLHPFAKMEFAGLIAAKAKSASRLSDFLCGLTGVKVELDEFVGSWLVMEPNERSRVGAAMSTLGADCMAGASQFSVSDKFRVRVYARDFEHYLSFLPGKPLAQEIGDAVFLTLGDEFDWDMELAIPAGEARPVRLGEGATLGWTSWMSPNWAKTDETIRADARFHVVSRLGRDKASADQGRRRN